MIQLTADESRVLGVLVEKAMTTPAQYPLTLNAVISGANQRSNRDPVTSLSEDRVLDALDSLRTKKLAAEVVLSGSRVAKYKHDARAVLEVDSNELAVLTELLLRGPQTIGELRGRASRMVALEDLEVVRNVLDHLARRDEPLVESVDPLPGSRARRWAQRLSPNLHAVSRTGAGADAEVDAVPARASAFAAPAGPTTDALRSAIEHLADRLGERDAVDRILRGGAEGDAGGHSADE